jgi:hypothetical protein
MPFSPDSGKRTFTDAWYSDRGRETKSVGAVGSRLFSGAENARQDLLPWTGGGDHDRFFANTRGVFRPLSGLRQGIVRRPVDGTDARCSLPLVWKPALVQQARRKEAQPGLPSRCVCASDANLAGTRAYFETGPGMSCVRSFRKVPSGTDSPWMTEMNARNMARWSLTNPLASKMSQKTSDVNRIR